MARRTRIIELVIAALCANIVNGSGQKHGIDATCDASSGATGCDVGSGPLKAVKDKFGTSDSASLLQVRVQEHEKQDYPYTDLGHGGKPGPSEVTLLGSDVNNEHGLSTQRSGFDHTDCDVQLWVDDRVCEFWNYNDHTYHFGVGDQHNNERAKKCANYCDNGKSNVKDNTFWFSLGQSGDCRCCKADGTHVWSDGLWAWATWKCVARPVACRMTAWSEWGACSTTCGSGTRGRSRAVASQPRFGGQACGPTEDSEECGQPCPIDCTLGSWSDWAACSATCGDGTKTRHRSVTVDAQHGGQPCEGAYEASKDCREKECPVHCTLSEWGTWSACSATCGKGERSRSRGVTVEAQHGGQKCDDVLKASEECKEKECPVDCVVSQWEDWGSCSQTCGGGTRSRSRTVTSDPQHGGECPGPFSESADCPHSECPQSIVCGQVKNAADNSPVSGVQVKIPEQSLEQVTQDGEFCFTGPAPGTVTITTKKEGWVDHSAEVVIADGMTNFDDVVISQKLAPTEWRIVLTWQKKPKDLDSHTNFGGCEVKHSKKTADNCGNGMTGVLDLDNRDISQKQEPETTTIKDVDPNKCGNNCMIHFTVNNYSKEDDLLVSQAKVQVIHGDKEVQHFEVEKAGKGDGVISNYLWYVFAIDAKSNKVIACDKASPECF